MDFGGPNLGTLLHEGTPSNSYIWAPHTAMGCFFLRNLWHLLECTHNPKNGIQEIYGCKSDPYAIQGVRGTIRALIKHHTSCWGCLIFATGVGAVCGWKSGPSGWCQLQVVHLQSCWYLRSHLDESKFCEKWGSSQNRCARIPDIPFFTRIWVAKKGHPERQIAENYQRDCLIVSFHGKSCQQFWR